MAKTYTIVKTIKYGMHSDITYTGTLSELIEFFNHTLYLGDLVSYKKYSKKINRIPKTIKSLLTNLNNAQLNITGSLSEGFELI